MLDPIMISFETIDYFTKKKKMYFSKINLTLEKFILNKIAHFAMNSNLLKHLICMLGFH